MKKIKNFFKDNRLPIFTLLISMIVVSIIFVLQDVSPFGEHSLLTIDFYHQYGPMMGELFDRIKNGSNLLYSFNMGMGLPFFRNFFNYMSSFFNIFLFLFKRSDLLTSYSIIIGLKVSFSAFTMNLFLKNKFKKTNISYIALSILYAFCAYFTAYYWNIMWIDGMVFLPLVALGIERLVNYKKPMVYIISLASMLFSNYFIGYMICIFSVLYFIVYVVFINDKISWKDVCKRFVLFGASSLIAGGLCAIFLIPMYYSMSTISATEDLWPTSQYYDFTLIEFIYNHFSAVGSTVLKSGITNAPNISISIIALPLLLLFIINPKIKLNIKSGYLFLIFFLIFSFFFAPLDYIWHAFHVPNDLPYRYSFIYSFILIIISAYSINEIKSIKSYKVIITYILFILLTTSMYFINYENINQKMILLNYIIITVWFLAYIIYKYLNLYKVIVPIILIVASSFEIIVGINNNWNISQNLEAFYSDYDTTNFMISFINKNDTNMHRIEKIDMHTFNDPSWYNYYGETTFSSMAYENMAAMQNKFGMPGNQINSYYYKQNTPIYDLMFNIKYLIGKSKDTNNYILYYSDAVNDNFVYKSKYTAGLMFGTNENIKKFNALSDNPFTNQNDFVYKTTGYENSLIEVKTTNEIIFEDDDNLLLKYNFSSNNNLYLYIDSIGVNYFILNDTLYYLDENYNEYDNSINYTNVESYNEKYIINFKSDGNNSLYISFKYGYENDGFYLYQLDNYVFDQAYQKLLNDSVNIEKFNEYQIEATINYSENKTIYTSIPYDEGWTVFVDGKKQEKYIINNTLLGFDVPKGEHNVIIKYKIPYLNISLVISIMSLFSLFLIKRKRKTT